MLTNNAPDNCPYPEEMSGKYACACCQGEIYDGEHCYLIADEYYCDVCVTEVIAGEG